MRTYHLNIKPRLRCLRVQRIGFFRKENPSIIVLKGDRLSLIHIPASKPIEEANFYLKLRNMIIIGSVWDTRQSR